MLFCCCLFSANYFKAYTFRPADFICFETFKFGEISYRLYTSYKTYVPNLAP